LIPSPTDNMQAGAATVPASNPSNTGSFWDFFSFSNKSSDAQSETLGPGAANIPVPTTEAK